MTAQTPESFGEPRVVVLSDKDTGGAAIACRRLVRGLREQAPVNWLVATAASDADAVSATAWPTLGSWLRHRCLARSLRDDARLRAVRNRYYEANMARAVRRMRPAVVNVHNVHGAMGFEVIGTLAPWQPLVWTLHDMWALTGYCYQSCGCSKFVSGCEGVCPEAGHCGASPRPVSVEWQFREALMRRIAGRLQFVAPSQWMLAQVERRFGGRVPATHIPNGVDLTVFRPLAARRAVREALGLPADGAFVLTGAQSVSDPYKGGAAALGLARAFPDAGIGVLGDWQAELPRERNLLPLGFVRDERLLNLYYNAADAFVLPSRAENLPSMLIEAIAAGTPVVAYDVGACGEIACDDRTGFLAPPADELALVACVRRVLEAAPDDVRRWQGGCRALAERSYDVRIQSALYLELYRRAAGGQQESTRGKP